MVVLLIALLIGLIFFFIGLSLITVFRKELENDPVEIIEESRRELEEEELIEPIPEQNGTYLLGILLGAEGILLSVLSVVGLLIQGFLVKIPIYLSIPALVIYILGCGVWNSLKMYKE